MKQMLSPLQSWDSKGLLLNHLANYSRKIVIGKDVEAPRGYYSCALRDAENPIQIGIIVNQPKAPSVLFLSTSRYVVFGYDQSISTVDPYGVSPPETTLLEGVFFEFYRVVDQNLILVLHELGCLALSEKGEMIWHHTTDDILKDWSVSAGYLTLIVMDSETPLVLDLATGTQK